jgi:hypothetical protein
MAVMMSIEQFYDVSDEENVTTNQKNTPKSN